VGKIEGLRLGKRGKVKGGEGLNVGGKGEGLRIGIRGGLRVGEGLGVGKKGRIKDGKVDRVRGGNKREG
jgi:hypothetical protein